MADVPLPNNTPNTDVDIVNQPLNVSANVQNAAILGETNSTGSSNAAQVNSGSNTSVEVMYDTSGAATITVEVSPDGNDWYERATFGPSSAVALSQLLEVGTTYVRAYADSNLNTLALSVKGV